MAQLVIHDYNNDSSIQFLTDLYDVSTVTPVGRKQSSSAILRLLSENDDIMILGHGGTNGLYSRQSANSYFDRILINSSMVEQLRNKKLICIWCYANEFAEKYKLTGLFSGMIISEVGEAEFVLELDDVSFEEVEHCNHMWVDAFKELIATHQPEEIPELMKNYQWDNEGLTENERKINEFNFNSWYFY